MRISIPDVDGDRSAHDLVLHTADRMRTERRRAGSRAQRGDRGNCDRGDALSVVPVRVVSACALGRLCRESCVQVRVLWHLSDAHGRFARSIRRGRNGRGRVRRPLRPVAERGQRTGGYDLRATGVPCACWLRRGRGAGGGAGGLRAAGRTALRTHVPLLLCMTDSAGTCRATPRRATDTERRSGRARGDTRAAPHKGGGI